MILKINKTMRSKLILFAILASLSAAAQVNVESYRIRTDTTGWFGSLESEANFAQSVKSMSNVDIDSKLEQKGKTGTFLIAGKLSLDNAAGSSLNKDGFLHLRTTRTLYKKLSYEAFAQTQYNKVLGVDNRELLGVGLRYTVFRHSKFRLYVAASHMLEYEKPVDGARIVDSRLSTYESFTVEISKVLSFINTTYYQPLYSNAANYRVLLSTQLVMLLSKHLSYKTGYDLYYDSRPLPGIPNRTYAFRNTLALDF